MYPLVRTETAWASGLCYIDSSNPSVSFILQYFIKQAVFTIHQVYQSASRLYGSFQSIQEQVERVSDLLIIRDSSLLDLLVEVVADGLESPVHFTQNLHL